MRSGAIGVEVHTVGDDVHVAVGRQFAQSVRIDLRTRQHRIGAFAGATLEGFQLSHLACKEPPRPCACLDAGARREQAMFDVVRVERDGHAIGHAVGMRDEREHVEVDQVGIAGQRAEAFAQRGGIVLRHQERRGREGSAQDGTSQRAARAFAGDAEGFHARHLRMQRRGFGRQVVIPLEAQQRHFVPGRQRTQHMPCAQLVAFARREGQAAGHGEDAGHQCFFHSRDGSIASDAGNDRSAAKFSITKLLAAGSSGRRAATRGNTRPPSAPP